MPKTYIYCLMEPDTSEVRYVGKANDPEKRYMQHLTDVRNARVVNWVQARLRSGNIPTWGILEVCEAENAEALDDVWAEAEVRWIAYFKDNGSDLLNHAIGGKGVRRTPPTEKTRKKISESKKGRTAHNKGKKFSSEQKQRAAETKATRALARKQAIGGTRVQDTASPKRKVNLQAVDLGALLKANEEAVVKRHEHEEYLQALKENSKLKQVNTPESNMKRKNALTGRKRTDAERAALSRGAKARVARMGSPVANQTKEAREKQSRTMRERYRMGLHKKPRKLTPEEMEAANEKRRAFNAGRFLGDREKATESNRINGLIKMHRNDIREIEALLLTRSPEEIFQPPVKLWYAETGQNRRFLSGADFKAFHDSLEEKSAI